MAQPKKTKQKQKTRQKKSKFEDNIDIIDQEIYKRRGKWNLSAISWMDYDDVAQLIRIHIYKKWDQYDQSQKLAPWVSRIVFNQIKNLIRNHYGNYKRPCLTCAAALPSDECKIYGEQCVECPDYYNWTKNKKFAHDTKITLPMEHHMNEIVTRQDESSTDHIEVEGVHAKMRNRLTPLEWVIYRHLYIQGKSEESLAKMLGYRTTEKGRKPGYKHIRNIEKRIIEKTRKFLQDGDN